MRQGIIVGLVLVSMGSAWAVGGDARTEKVFYVYDDKGARVNHFAPSGWMGDYGDIKINDGDRENPGHGKTSFKIEYTAEGKQGANWAGIFWQQPPNNWGNKPGGYNLTGFKRVRFLAKGEKGGEKIAEFKVGGIVGDYGDSAAATLTGTELTTKWKEYTIELTDGDWSNIVGGFCWSASRDDNPKGFIMWVDNIRWEK